MLHKAAPKNERREWHQYVVVVFQLLVFFSGSFLRFHQLVDPASCRSVTPRYFFKCTSTYLTAYLPICQVHVCLSLSLCIYQSMHLSIFISRTSFPSSTLQEINISHLGERKIIFKMDFSGDMLVPRRVMFFQTPSLLSNPLQGLSPKFGALGYLAPQLVDRDINRLDD